MSMINTNVMSLNSQRNLATNNASLGTTIQRLSSGLRINSAKDDAAGLAISERFTTQIRGLNQAARNANDGISLAQTAEGALGEISNNLQRIRELAVQSRNATNSADDRAALQKEATQLKAEIDRVANQTSFNGTKLLDGSFTTQAFQVGANQGETITIDSIADSNIAALGTWTSASLGPAVPTTSTLLGAMSGNQVSSADGQQFRVQIDGIDVINAVQSGGVTETVDTARMQAAFDAFDSAQAGYTISGTLAGGDLQVSKADGTDMDIQLTTDFGTTTSWTGWPAFMSLHTNGTPATAESKVGFEDLDISTAAGADDAILAMDAALNSVNSSRADLGAIQNRFSSVISNLNTTSENLSASRSRIRDTDFAKETAELTRTQILNQAGTAMLAQANQVPQSVLSLLR